MGQQNSREGFCGNIGKSFTNSSQDLVYYTTVEDFQFGKIPVYNSVKKPSSYVAKVERKVQNSKIYNIFQHIQNDQLSCLASLHAFQIRRDKFFTGHIYQHITAYWEYYNYSFTQYLKIRSLKRIPFTQSQIWLVIKTCCQSFSLFNSHNLVLDLDLNHVVVIPEGKLKIYWHQVQLDNQHLKFYQKVKNNSRERLSLKKQLGNRRFRYQEQKQTDFFYFSPEQIEGIQKRQETMNIDFGKTNSFRLGMIILYCITLANPIKTCYGSQNNNNRIKIMVLNSLYENKIENSSKYSQDLKHLVKLLLLQDPNKRIPISCLQNVYQKNMQEDVQLAMGMNDNPLYAPSSSRKNLKQEQNRMQNSHEKVYNNSNPNHIRQQKDFAQKESLNIVQQSRIRSSQRSYVQFNEDVGSIHQKQRQNYDKFDTKTIKISSSYHKK